MTGCLRRPRPCLDEAESIELISLDPRERAATPAETFHGWKVLGRAVLRDVADLRTIVTSLKRGIREADKVSGCFEPRHGLRAKKGDRSVDLVICFSCGWIEVHSEGKASSVWTSDPPKSAFERGAARRGRSRLRRTSRGRDRSGRPDRQGFRVLPLGPDRNARRKRKLGVVEIPAVFWRPSDCRLWFIDGPPEGHRLDPTRQGTARASRSPCAEGRTARVPGGGRFVG